MLYGEILTNAADSTTTTVGDTEQENRIKRSFAVWHLLGYEQMSKVMWQEVMPWVWLKSCCCFGGNQQGDAGGKALSWMMWKASKPG